MKDCPKVFRLVVTLRVPKWATEQDVRDEFRWRFRPLELEAIIAEGGEIESDDHKGKRLN